jgi:DNA-binding NtrC family response regulator
MPELRQSAPHAAIIVITAYEDVRTAISAMKAGAVDYLVKPVRLEALSAALGRTASFLRLGKEARLLQERALREHMPFFIAESDAITAVMDLVGRVAQSPDTPVLVEGETGTGKELLASAIHLRSPLFRGPLVSLNCAAIPRDLVESELFGYAPGAFSGAERRGKAGLVATADGGTLFLDEVGELPLEVQAKLLRFVQSGEFYPVGATRPRTVQTRIIAATNRNLEECVAQGTFRQDLFFRLAVVRIRVPSLAERQGDILPMARAFLHEFASKFARELTGLTPEAEACLLAHSWPGNVRELKNLMERAALLARGPQITPEDLGLEAPSRPPAAALPPLSPEGLDLPRLLTQVERHYLSQALALAQGNESQAARLLQLTRDTFRYRRAKLLPAPDKGHDSASPFPE